MLVILGSYSMLLLLQSNRSREKKTVHLETSILVSHLFRSFSTPEWQQTCLSPVSILGVYAGSPIKAGVAGVGWARLVGHFPGSAATHSQRCHLQRDQGKSTWVYQGGRVADAQLCGAAAGCLAICAHALIHLHLAHIHTQQWLQLQRVRKGKKWGDEGDKYGNYINSQWRYKDLYLQCWWQGAHSDIFGQKEEDKDILA